MDKIGGRARLQLYLLSCIPAPSPLTAKTSECTSQNSTRRMNVVTLGRRTQAVGGVQRSREVKEELTWGGMLGHVDARTCAGPGLLSEALGIRTTGLSCPCCVQGTGLGPGGGESLPVLVVSAETATEILTNQERSRFQGTFESLVRHP